MLVDTHCHIEEKNYGDLKKLVKGISQSNVKIIVVSGYDVQSSKEAIKLAHEFNNVYATVGFHPHESQSIKEEDYRNFDIWLKDKKVVAVGEIGLDYYYGYNTKDDQKQMFIKQIEIAVKYKKPVVVHNRNASLEICEILKKYNIKGVIHCFNDDIKIARKFIDIGFLLGVGGIITFKNNTLKNVIKDIPLEYIVLETDSPYLSPEPFRGKQNNPMNLPMIAKELAKIKEIEYNKVASVTTSNASRLFDFS